MRTWLYHIATNACLDELERRPRRPEPRVDPYPADRLLELADPVADPAARYARQEGLALALLTAIQRLPGRQRAVLILRDVLGWTAAETAELLDTTVAGANSALQRARATLEDVVPSPRASPPPGAERELLRRYVAAWEASDMEALVSLLREDAVLSMPPQPAICGAVAIGRFFAGVEGRVTLQASAVAAAGGSAAVLLRERDGRPHRLLVLETDDDGARLAAVHAYREPAVLSAFSG